MYTTPEILETWNGPVYDYDNNNYLTELLPGITYSEFVIPCVEDRIPELNYYDVIDIYLEANELEERFSDNDFNGSNELKIAIEIFNRANDHLKMYTTLDNKLIRVPTSQ